MEFRFTSIQAGGAERREGGVENGWVFGVWCVWRGGSMVFLVFVPIFC